MMATTSAVVPSGSTRFSVAPASTSSRGRAERALPRRVHQRRPPPCGRIVSTPSSPNRSFAQVIVVRARVDVGAARDQQLDGLGMILGRGPHQRRFAERLFTGVRIGAVVEDQANGLGIARPRGAPSESSHPAGSSPSRRRRPRAAAGPSAPLALVAAIDSGVSAVPVRRVRRSRPRRRAARANSSVVAAHGPVQRRRAIGFGHVDVRRRRGRLEQRAHRGAVARLDRLDQRQLASAGGQRRDRENAQPGECVSSWCRSVRLQPDER